MFVSYMIYVYKLNNYIFSMHSNIFRYYVASRKYLDAKYIRLVHHQF